MPQLIKNVQGEVHNETVGTVILIKSISGEIQREDYIDINGSTFYLQNFSKIEETSLLTTPLSIGLINKNNIDVVTIEINY